MNTTPYNFKGSPTHLQALQISMKFLPQVASDIGRLTACTVKVLDLKIFQFRIMQT